MVALVVTLHFLDAFSVPWLSFVADGVIGVKVEATTIISYLSGKPSPVAQIIKTPRTRQAVAFCSPHVVIIRTPWSCLLGMSSQIRALMSHEDRLRTIWVTLFVSAMSLTSQSNATLGLN